MKARRGSLALLIAAVALVLLLAACEQAEVNILMNLSTETGAGDLTMEVFINWEDDSKDQLPNNVEGVVNSVRDYFDLKGIGVTFSPITDVVVQFWDSDDIPGTGQQVLTDTMAKRFTFTFTFGSIEELNRRVATLSDNRPVATNEGLAQLVPNTVDGTLDFVFRNQALEELLAGITEHIMNDGDNYSGDKVIEDMSRTRTFYAVIDGVAQSRALGPWGAFNRSFNFAGNIVDESRIVAPVSNDDFPVGIFIAIGAAAVVAVCVIIVVVKGKRPQQKEGAL